jgi:hypothetical protein
MNDIVVDQNEDGEFILTVVVNGEQVWTEAASSSELPKTYSELNTLFFSK